nr:two-component sensor histidine kinase [Chitinophagaceae bacterium]
AIGIVAKLGNEYYKHRVLEQERARSQAKELEQAKEIEKAYKELAVSHTALKNTQAQLIQSEKMASLGELTAGIAHEIQNPLNFVNNFSELNSELVKELEEETSNEQRDPTNEALLLKAIKENSQKINHHGKRAESIVKGMLEHSRKSTGIKEPTDLNKLCEEFIRLSYHGLRANDKSFNCEYKLDLDPKLPLVNLVSQDIGRVVLNIVNNAFQACFQQSESLKSKSQNDYKPCVTVSTKYVASLGPESSVCELIISDNGPGIPDSIKDKIFQPFFTTKPTGQGTGLGLSLSYDIVKSHGGTIHVNSDHDRGTTFIIQLPLIQRF